MLKLRIGLERPWHSPPTVFHEGRFHVAAACLDHRPHIGVNLKRIESFSELLLSVLKKSGTPFFAWCVLPNHYHLLIETRNLSALKWQLGRLHGRTAKLWNLEDDTPRRTVWHRCSDRAMRNERHFWVTMNYSSHPGASWLCETMGGLAILECLELSSFGREGKGD